MTTVSGNPIVGYTEDLDQDNERIFIMAIKLHNIPAAVTKDKVTNVIIEHGLGRLVFHRIKNSNMVQVSITPNIAQERKQHQFMLSLGEFDMVLGNLDLEEVEFDEID